jgi:hypothetical protein
MQEWRRAVATKLGWTRPGYFFATALDAGDAQRTVNINPYQYPRRRFRVICIARVCLGHLFITAG